MHIGTKLLKKQLMLLRPILTHEALGPSRVAQEGAGALMKCGQLQFENVDMEKFEAAMAMPKQKLSSGAILYLHGGGYTAGGLKYAQGFGSILAERTGVKTLCAAYRLAPEHPYPAALEDAYTAYRYLVRSGVPEEKIILSGESAGGGLCFALCLYLNKLGEKLPGGIVAISPWTDLTLSGKSLHENADKDPLLTKDQLQFFVKCYAEGKNTKDPFISPLFGDLKGMPDSLLFAGGDELLLSDAENLYTRLQEAGVQSELYVCPEMWHAYVLYGTEETKDDFEQICRFVKAHIG